MGKKGTWVLLCTATFTLLFLFQNCAPQDLTGGIDKESGEDPGVVPTYNPALDDLPFPYEINYSQLAYLSCTQNGGPVSAGNYTYMLSSHNVFDRQSVPVAGLSISTEFFDRLREIPEVGGTMQGLRDALRYSKNAKDFVPILSMGMLNNNANIQNINGQFVVSPMFSNPLSDEGYVEAFLASRGAPTNYFLPQPEFPIFTFDRAVVARVKITAPNNGGAGAFAGLRGSSQLTATFGNYEEGNGETPFVPRPRNGIGYGKGYDIQFGPAGSGAYNANNVVTAVNEKRLETNTAVSATWRCDPNYKFKIVRKADRNKLIRDKDGIPVPACPYQSALTAFSTTNLERLRIIQRMLPASDWDINLDRNCIVPLNDTCYPNDDLVNYDDKFYATANNGLSPPQYSGCDVSGQPACPHFMSICYRTDF